MAAPPRKHAAQRTTGATWLAWACAAVLGLSSLPVGAHIELKASFVALAVGNTAYEHIGSDSCGENDAEAVAAAPAGKQFRDCADCPEMVVIPAGRFEMGCDTEDCDDDEKPAHEVQIRDDFALGRYEVTVGEFRRFVEAKGYRSDAEQDAGRGCWEVLMGRKTGWTPGRSWRKSGVRGGGPRAGDVRELETTRRRMRRGWGSGRARDTGCRARRSGSTRRGRGPGRSTTSRTTGRRCAATATRRPRRNCCRTLSWGAAMGRRTRRPWGAIGRTRSAYTTCTGNVWEWAGDCWNRSYAGAPTDGSAWLSGDCGQRVFRGGLWSFLPRLLRGGNRYRNHARYRSIGRGFRVARTLDPQVDASATPHERQ